MDPEETSQENPVIAEGGDTGESVGTGVNPSWQPVLDLLPERIQQSVIPHFKGWDDNYKKLQTEYNAYKQTATPREPSPLDEFNGIDPASIRTALQVAQNIQSDPRRVAELLAESQGLTLSEAKAVVAEAKKQQTEFEFSEDDDPRLKQMYEMMQASQDRLSKFEQDQQTRYQQELQRQQQMEEERLQAQYDTQVQNELAALMKANPQLQNADPSFMEMLWMKAGHLAGQGDKTPLQSAYTQLNSFTESIKQTVAPKSTPLFVPTNGQAPPANETANMSTRDKALAMLQRIQSPGQG